MKDYGDLEMDYKEIAYIYHTYLSLDTQIIYFGVFYRMDKVSVACDFSLNYLLGLRFNDSCAL
jgi:hypothetical protein